MVAPLLVGAYTLAAGAAGLGIGSVAADVKNKKESTQEQASQGGSGGGTPSQSGFSLLDFSSPEQEFSDQRSYSPDFSSRETDIDNSQETFTYNPQFTDARTTSIILDSPYADITSKKDASQASSVTPTQTVPIQISQPSGAKITPSFDGGKSGANLTAIAAIGGAALVGYAFFTGGKD